MSKVIHISQDILGGVPVFNGTRVPISALFDYLEDGDTIDEFLLDFPAVSREQIVRLLDDIRKDVVGSPRKVA